MMENCSGDETGVGVGGAGVAVISGEGVTAAASSFVTIRTTGVTVVLGETCALWLQPKRESKKNANVKIAKHRSGDGFCCKMFP